MYDACFVKLHFSQFSHLNYTLALQKILDLFFLLMHPSISNICMFFLCSPSSTRTSLSFPSSVFNSYKRWFFCQIEEDLFLSPRQRSSAEAQCKPGLPQTHRFFCSGECGAMNGTHQRNGHICSHSKPPSGIFHSWTSQ